MLFRSSKAAIDLAIADIDKAIKNAATRVPITSAKTLVAVAGTATTVAAAALGLESYDLDLIHLSRISAEKTHQVCQSLLTLERSEITSLGYMHPGRVDVIAAGSLVLSRIMAIRGVSEFVASESDILDGMALLLAK